MSTVDFFARFDQALADIAAQRQRERAELDAALQLAEEVLSDILVVLDEYAVGLTGRLDAVTEHSAHTRELSIEEQESRSFRKLIYTRSESGQIAAYQVGIAGDELEPDQPIMPMSDPRSLTKATVQQQVEAFLLAVIAERPDLVLKIAT
ncbi:hypothetical protein BKE38_01825 [Pseudoroseomonas deserti]|uniref:Uncharacterized protein n=1 Tax=Teichococcus deserti TaxID=1817963 RepID=A0A1V2H7P1_9PROT|nr:hypothetical protein [Pseudoroseomonas deserti]ONG58796.1 hypothetical protein BKE38_01825 [Pseudoroseomonas deserti]